MKKILFVFALLCCSTTLLKAQFTFDWMEGAGNNSKISIMSAVDSEDNLIITGYWQNFKVYVRKYDITGSLLWEVEDASGISGIYEKSNSISIDADNNIYIVGNMYAYSSSTGWDYPTDIIALKYTPSGTLLWKKIIPISITITVSNRFNTSSVVDTFGNLYIGSVINAPDGAILYKIDPNGNLLSMSSSLENLPRNFNSIKIKNDKIAIVSGSPTTNVGPVFVFDTSGNLLWTAAIEGISALDVAFDENENVYVLSSLYNAVSGSSGYDMTITKFDATGNFLWVHYYDLGGAEISRKFVYLNNRISAIGYGASSQSSAYFDWKTIQTNENGDLLWSAIYDATTFNDEEPYGITAKPSGEVIVTGKGGPSPDPNNPSFIQMPLVEYNNLGDQLWVDTPNKYGGWGLATIFASDGSLYAISSTDMTAYHYFGLPLGITSHDSIFNSIKVYPNPVINSAILEINLKMKDTLYITIFDVFGKIVSPTIKEEISVGKVMISLDISTLCSGIYFCQIKGENNSQTVKLIKG